MPPAEWRATVAAVKMIDELQTLYDAEARNWYTPEVKAAAWDLATAALARWRDAGCPAPPPATDEELHELIEFVVGEQTTAYFDLLKEELALDGDERAPGWRVQAGRRSVRRRAGPPSRAFGRIRA